MTKSITYVIKKIKWDTDGEKVDLPKEFRFKRSKLLKDGIIDKDDDENAIFDALSDFITDETGFCHNGFRSSIE